MLTTNSMEVRTAWDKLPLPRGRHGHKSILFANTNVHTASLGVLDMIVCQMKLFPGQMMLCSWRELRGGHTNRVLTMARISSEVPPMAICSGAIGKWRTRKHLYSVSADWWTVLNGRYFRRGHVPNELPLTLLIRALLGVKPARYKKGLVVVGTDEVIEFAHNTPWVRAALRGWW